MKKKLELRKEVISSLENKEMSEVKGAMWASMLIDSCAGEFCKSEQCPKPPVVIINPGSDNCGETQYYRYSCRNCPY